MKNGFSKITLSLLFAVLLGLTITISIAAQRPAGGPPAQGQGPGGPPPQFDPDHHIGGKLSAINGNTITVTNREGETLTITVNANTKYVRNREAATLSSFQANDFL